MLGLPASHHRLALACLCTSILCSCGGTPASDVAKAANEAGPPGLEIMGAAAIAERLKQGSGRVVVLNCWATWCAPCVAEMPHFARLYRQTSRDKVFLLSLSVDDPADETKVRAFIAQQALPFPVVLADCGPDDLGAALGLELTGALPQTYVYRPSGALARHWDEAIDYATLRGAIDAAP